MNNERTVYGMDMERQPGETSAREGAGGREGGGKGTAGGQREPGDGGRARARGGANQRIEQNNEIESLVVAAHTFHA